MATERLVALARHPIVGETRSEPARPIALTKVRADAAGIEDVLFAFEYRIGTRAEMPNPAMPYPPVAVRARGRGDKPRNGDESAVAMPIATRSE